MYKIIIKDNLDYGTKISVYKKFIFWICIAIKYEYNPQSFIDRVKRIYGFDNVVILDKRKNPILKID